MTLEMKFWFEENDEKGQESKFTHFFLSWFLSAPSLSPSSSDVPAVKITDDESVSMSIWTASDNLLQSLVTDTLLDWTMEMAFEAIDMDTELEKCKHLRIIFATSKRCVKKNQMIVWMVHTTVLKIPILFHEKWNLKIKKLNK